MMQVRTNQSPSDQTLLGKLRSKLSQQDDPQASARKLFDGHLHGSGTRGLGKEGLRQILEGQGVSASETEVKDMFEALDMDGSRDVSFEEFINALGVDRTKMLEWIQSTGVLAPLVAKLPPMSVSELPEYFSSFSEVSHAHARTHREGEGNTHAQNTSSSAARTQARANATT